MPMYNRRFGYDYDSNTELTVYFSILTIACFSFVANSFVLYLIFRMRFKWNTFSHQLITAISVVDMLSTLGVFSGHLSRFSLGFPGIFESTWYCRFFWYHYGSVSMLFWCIGFHVSL